MPFRPAKLAVIIGVLLTMRGTADAQSNRLRCEGDLDGDGRVTVDEILVSVDNALSGCPPPPTASASPTPTPTVASVCAGASLALDAGVSASCLAGATERGDDCARVRIEGNCPVGRACAAATAHCACVGGPLAGVASACQFTTIPGGIRCGGICTGDCVISIEAQ